MKAKLRRTIPFLSGDVVAGTLFDVLSVTLHHNGRGISGVPVEDVEFIIPDDKAVSTVVGTEQVAMPWIGPNATVKVPEFVPAAKAETVKPPTGVVTSHGGKRAVKPAGNQKSMFDSIDEI